MKIRSAGSLAGAATSTLASTIEGVWVLRKTGIQSSRYAVLGKYLQSYLDHYVLRYNHREEEARMFEPIQKRITKVRHGPYEQYLPFDPVEIN